MINKLTIESAISTNFTNSYVKIGLFWNLQEVEKKDHLHLLIVLRWRTKNWFLPCTFYLNIDIKKVIKIKRLSYT